MTRVDPTTPCIRNVTPRNAGDGCRWYRVNLPRGCGRSGERGQGSRGLQKVTMQQTSRSRSHSDAKTKQAQQGLPAAQDSQEHKKLLCFSNGWFKAYKPQSHFPAAQPQLKKLQLERGSRAARGGREEVASNAQPFHRTGTPGSFPPLGGQSRWLCSALCVQQSSSSVRVKPRERLGCCAAGCSGFADQAGLGGQVVS